MPRDGDNLIPLAKGSVLYLGSAVPLETSVGLEALQGPLRDRYLTSDPYQKVSGIDAVLTVFSSGVLMQYPGDDSSTTWFPMQTLHMCAAVKAVTSSNTGSASAFVSIDSPPAMTSREPPIFAVIMRRSKGVKVLECHVFVCRSTDAALGFVQSCTHAFQHQEGWLSGGMPGPGAFGSSARIVAAESGSGMLDVPRTQLQGFMYSQDQPTQLYNISGMEPPRTAPVPAPIPVPPAPVPPVVQVVQPPPTAGVQPIQYISMNPPGAPVPQSPQMMIPQGYFTDWDQNYGMTYMVVPSSPLYPGDKAYNKEEENTKNKSNKNKKNKKNKKKNKKNKKSKSRKKHEEEEEEEDDDDEEEEEEEDDELFYIRRSRLNQSGLPPGFVQVQPEVNQVSDRYAVQTGQPDVRYTTEPVGPPAQPQTTTREIHYIPISRSSQFLPPDLQPDMQELTGSDVYLAQVPPSGGGYFYEDQGPPDSQFGGVGQGYDPYAYRFQLQDLDYDYRQGYDAARQQGPGGSQGVYDMKLPRTDFNYQFDERGFDGMADRLGYFP